MFNKRKLKAWWRNSSFKKWLELINDFPKFE